MAKGGVDRWNHVFRTACLLEADLFNTGLRPPAPYHIIPDGTYFIHSPSLKNVVLAVQNIKGVLRSPLDQLLGGYFPSDAGLSVVGVNKTGEDNEKVNLRCVGLLFVFNTNWPTCIVACRCNQKRIHIPKFGDRSLSWNRHRIKSERRPSFARC